ncbi:unnamed protein product [Arctogadus glacialis]
MEGAGVRDDSRNGGGTLTELDNNELLHFPRHTDADDRSVSERITTLTLASRSPFPHGRYSPPDTAHISNGQAGVVTPHVGLEVHSETSSPGIGSNS